VGKVTRTESRGTRLVGAAAFPEELFEFMNNELAEIRAEAAKDDESRDIRHVRMRALAVQ
jgi:hypothetical protein